MEVCLRPYQVVAVLRLAPDVIGSKFTSELEGSSNSLRRDLQASTLERSYLDAGSSSWSVAGYCSNYCLDCVFLTITVPHSNTSLLPAVISAGHVTELDMHTHVWAQRTRTRRDLHDDDDDADMDGFNQTVVSSVSEH